MRRRVVLTGVGIISSIGNDYECVIAALRAGKSGVRAVPSWAQYGLKSLVAGTVEGIIEKQRASALPRSLVRGMSNAALYCTLAASDAVKDAGLSEDELHDTRTGCAIGSAVAGVDSIYQAGALLFSGRLRAVDPYLAFQAMSSTASAAVANALGIQGRSYSICSACSTSAHNIGVSYELIRAGVVDRMIAGGGEEITPLFASAFDALRLVLSTHYNDVPEAASRPYDAGRDGLVLSSGAAVVVLEALDCAERRGARARAEIIGFGANSDGYDLAVPEPEGRQASVCIEMALDDANLGVADVDYVNTHGTGTVQGDVADVNALRRVFGSDLPPFSSTKSMTGHCMAGSGAQEAIFCIGMLEHGFLAPSINIDQLDHAFVGLRVVRHAVDSPVRTTLSTSFGFGGTNAALLFRRV